MKVISDTTFRALHEEGATDGEIIEPLGVMEVLTSCNKFLNSLQVGLTSDRSPVRHLLPTSRESTM